MSRGLGAVQRRILERLKLNEADPVHDATNGTSAWTTIAELAERQSRTDLESTRRAVKTLAAAGLVETSYVRLRLREMRHYSWVLADREVLVVRLARR